MSMTKEEFGNLINEIGFKPSPQYEETFRLINAAVTRERERCLKIIHEHFVNYRGASIQTAFPEDAKTRCADTARAIEEIEKEVRES